MTQHEHPHCDHTDHHITDLDEAACVALIKRSADRSDADTAFRQKVDEATTVIMKGFPDLTILSLVNPAVGASWMMVAGVALLLKEEEAANASHG